MGSYSKNKVSKRGKVREQPGFSKAKRLIDVHQCCGWEISSNDRINAISDGMLAVIMDELKRSPAQKPQDIPWCDVFQAIYYTCARFSLLFSKGSPLGNVALFEMLLRWAEEDDVNELVVPKEESDDE